MNYITKLSGRSFLAGLLIGIACLVNCKVGGGVIGACLFSVGLMGVVILELDLYTGRIGYVDGGLFKGESGKVTASKIFGGISYFIVVLFFNFGGAAIVGLLFSSDFGVSQRASRGLLEVFISAVLCGSLMYIACDGWIKTKRILAIILPIATFILCGGEHCVADMCYLAAGYWNFRTILFITIVIVGNSIGAIFTRKLSES